VLEEHYGEYFETLDMPSSPHMLFTHKARRPQDTAAVVHVDSTSRVQTVNRQQNAYLYDIISEFKKLTGVPVVINTSFNLKGEPIVSSPADALKTFMASGLDSLALEDYVITKTADALPKVELADRDLAFTR
jgi:carbamoyltransferase